LESLLTADHATARIGARLRVAGAGEQLALADDMRAFARQNLDKRLTWRITGETERIAGQMRQVVRSLSDSFASTVFVIFLFMLVSLRSARAAILGLIPNVVPVIWTLGVMGIFGITLNFATVMITSIAVGVSVDDTVHFLIRCRRELESDPDLDRAITSTILHSGRAIVFTSVAMASGYSVFMLSDFSPSRTFGFLMALTMITALLTEVIVTPYLVKAWNIRFRRRNAP
jgi:predicted RND superfamily exporter protein